MHSMRLLDQAVRDLSRLDKPVSLRMIERLHWLAENFDKIRPETLSGDLADFCKFRVGDYRVIYQVIEDEQSIVVHAIGHRKEIYRKR